MIDPRTGNSQHNNVKSSGGVSIAFNLTAAVKRRHASRETTRLGIDATRPRSPDRSEGSINWTCTVFDRSFPWVVCGISLTGETQFAYRIGSFFHESSSGRRRGVIRDVSPEETWIPVISDRLPGESRVSLEQPDAIESSSAAEPKIPSIIEVPNWLAQLERQTAALDSNEPNESAVTQPAEREERHDPPEYTSPTRLNQQRLF